MTEAPLNPSPPAFPRRSLQALLEAPGTRTITLAMSKDPNAKVSVLVVPPGVQIPRLALKIPTTAPAAVDVEREARLLVDLRRMGLGPVTKTIPRFIQVCEHQGHIVLVASAVPGVPLAVTYNSWRHTARREHVAADFAAAEDWLTRFQDASTSSPATVDLLAGASERILQRSSARAPGSDARAGVEVAERVARLHDRLSGYLTPRTAVHGDFWFGNLLVEGPGSGAVSGVVDWEGGSTRGEPLRDLCRFAVSYSLYLDRHTPTGRRVPGHRGLRADHRCAALRYALTGCGWYPALVRRFLSDGLSRLGLPESLWYDIAWAGVADVAAGADDDRFSWRHITLLHSLPDPTGRRAAP